MSQTVVGSREVIVLIDGELDVGGLAHSIYCTLFSPTGP